MRIIANAALTNFIDLRLQLFLTYRAHLVDIVFSAITHHFVTLVN